MRLYVERVEFGCWYEQSFYDFSLYSRNKRIACADKPIDSMVLLKRIGGLLKKININEMIFDFNPNFFPKDEFLSRSLLNAVEKYNVKVLRRRKANQHKLFLSS